jgi:hypothetical protein
MLAAFGLAPGRTHVVDLSSGRINPTRQGARSAVPAISRTTGRNDGSRITDRVAAPAWHRTSSSMWSWHGNTSTCRQLVPPPRDSGSESAERRQRRREPPQGPGRPHAQGPREDRPLLQLAPLPSPGGTRRLWHGRSDRRRREDTGSNGGGSLPGGAAARGTRGGCDPADAEAPHEGSPVPGCKPDDGHRARHWRFPEATRIVARLRAWN